MLNRNLYDFKSFFQLVIDGTAYTINEPINWDKITIELPRDKDAFGFNFEFVNDTFQMGFADDDESYFLIKNVYDTLGSDGKILFQYCYILPNTTDIKIPFTGNINLNTYDEINGTINCSVEKVTFENLLRTRFGTPIAFNSTKTLDGKDFLSFGSNDVILHSKKINKQFRAEITDPISVDSAVISRFMSIQIDTSNAITNEVEENQSLPLAISGVDPRDELRYFFKVLEAGDYTLKVNYSFRLRIVRPGIGLPVGNYNVVPRFMVQRAGGTIDYVTFEQYRQTGSTSSYEKFLNFNCTFELSRSWLVNDFLYLDIDGQMQFAGGDYLYQVSDYKSSVQILGETVAPQTIAKGFRLFSALESMIEAATGQPDSLISSVLGLSGDLYKTYIMNGYSIRNFTLSDKPLTTSIEDCLNSICSVMGLGYAIKNIAGKDYLVVERIDHFFKDAPISEVKDISELRTMQAKDLVFNEIEIGFEKFPEKDLNTLDEFNTFQTNLTPIKTYKSKFTKKSKWITSGYAIEEQRREQFKDNPSESLSNDDEIFMISCNQNFINNSNYYYTFPDENKIKFDKVMNLEDGEMFSIIGGDNLANNNLTYEVVSKVVGIDEAYIIAGVGGDTLSIDQGKVLVQTYITGITQAEKDEAFDVVTGLFSPETSYNIRFSPRRMLFNWAKFLNIMFYRKPNTDIIKTTFVKNNDKMVSMLSIYDSHRGNEPLVPFGESEDITLAMFRGNKKEALHLPIFYTFNADMDYLSFSYIKDRVVGESGEENDNGYIYFLDEHGVMIKAFVYNLKYQPSLEIAEFQVAKIGNY